MRKNLPKISKEDNMKIENMEGSESLPVDCEVRAKPTLIYADKLTCGGCKRHVLTLPKFLNGEIGDKDSQCEYCGCTSIKFNEGRSFGRKHQDFGYWLKEWDEVKELYENEDLIKFFRFAP